jgi:hypothetical protein
MEHGSNFFGLMKTSRHFIGQALIYQPHVAWMKVEPTEFDFSEFAALVALTAAADRVSDFIITARNHPAALVEMPQRGATFRLSDSLRDGVLPAR